jgi:hypothetical protein
MEARRTRAPARHWSDRAHVVAGLDELAGGTWLALNDDGLVAAVLNRHGSLGVDTTRRSRGELPLEAADHAEAAAALTALRHINPTAYRTFNMVIADARDAFWLRSDGGSIRAAPIPEGLSMITAHDLNDTARSARMARHLDRFRRAPVPDIERGDWDAWKALLGSRSENRGEGREAREAMNVVTDFGFATVSSSLIALPRAGSETSRRQWLYCAGRPDEADYKPVRL